MSFIVVFHSIGEKRRICCSFASWSLINRVVFEDKI